jgi:hypothetical protein
MACGTTLLKPTVMFILFQQQNELGYDILVYVPIDCIIKEEGSHYTSTRESTP